MIVAKLFLTVLAIIAFLAPGFFALLLKPDLFKYHNKIQTYLIAGILFYSALTIIIAIVFGWLHWLLS